MKGEAPVRPAQLAVRFGLYEGQCEQLVALLTCLETDEQAPTTVRESSRAVDVHLADSLVALEVDLIGSAKLLADIGSGAGFPGLALAVAKPRSEVWLVESQTKKCQFLRRMIAAAGIDNALVVERRVEEWPEGLGAHDAVLARALAPAPVVLEYAAPLLALGGVLVDWRGRRAAEEEEAALAAAGQLGLQLEEIRGVHPFEGARDRHLHVYSKVRETPDRFPRRAGIARKRPLVG